MIASHRKNFPTCEGLKYLDEIGITALKLDLKGGSSGRRSELGYVSRVSVPISSARLESQLTFAKTFFGNIEFVYIRKFASEQLDRAFQTPDPHFCPASVRFHQGISSSSPRPLRSNPTLPGATAIPRLQLQLLPKKMDNPDVQKAVSELVRAASTAGTFELTKTLGQVAEELGKVSASSAATAQMNGLLADKLDAVAKKLEEQTMVMREVLGAVREQDANQAIRDKKLTMLVGAVATIVPAVTRASVTYSETTIKVLTTLATTGQCEIQVYPQQFKEVSDAVAGYAAHFGLKINSKHENYWYSAKLE